MELWTTITIECAHTSAALGVPALHGHSYWVQFFAATLVSNPVPLDAMQKAAEPLRYALDHKNLDTILDEATMESLAMWCVDHWHGPRLTRLVVRRDSLGCGVEWRA